MIVACACQRVGLRRLVSRPCPSTLVRLGPRRPVIRPYFCVCFYDNCRVLGREAPSVEEGLSMRKRSRRETPEQQVDASGSTTVVPS
ncbi:hypothetical protein BHE74_00036168 [Ensete ventricosum]|nr:hypothetical protein BHE74_00036168 [Ensete ventricosum]RZS11718.1 hypothetical protein BHM03_00043062 [Ensete ventricosum]